MPCNQAAILYSKCQFLSDSSSVHPSLIPRRRSRRSWTQMKVKSRPSFSLNLHPSTKMIVSVKLRMWIFAYFSQQAMFFLWESKEGEVSVVHIVMKKMKRWKLILVDGCNFSEKDGQNFTFIWVRDRQDRRCWIRDGWTLDESKRNWHLEYKMAAWLHGTTRRNVAESFLIWPTFDRNFNLQMDKSFNFIFLYVFFMIRDDPSLSESIRVDPTWTGGPS